MLYLLSNNHAPLNIDPANVRLYDALLLLAEEENGRRRPGRDLLQWTGLQLLLRTCWYHHQNMIGNVEQHPPARECHEAAICAPLRHAGKGYVVVQKSRMESPVVIVNNCFVVVDASESLESLARHA
ncbi:hypothetical protein AC578_9822 [Pseudocercospora eumusae]|uniref:Uncharacterized protein n=1 Tax=Pseudocercospora eumusae TaxID=321146 RepID=A0A139H9S8_9PEZI|nr:hypothetical protein AC578_9822 [Pseudocercospora eumusae]